MGKENLDGLRKKLDALRSGPGSNEEIAELLNAMAHLEFRNTPEIASKHAKEALDLAKKSGAEAVTAESYHLCSVTEWTSGHLEEALDYCRKSLQLWRKLGDDRGLGRAFNNLGNIHKDLGNYSKALQFHLKSLELKEQTEDTKGIALSHLNIGNTHKDQNNLKKAETHYLKSLEIFNSLDSKLNTAMCYNNIGIVKTMQKDFDSALEYHTRALKVRLSLNDTRGLLNSYGNLGSVYDKKKSFDKALVYVTKALFLAEKMGDRKKIVVSCFNLGSIHIKLGQLKAARTQIEKAMKLAEDFGAYSLEASSMSHLADLYEAEGNYKEAFLCERKYRKISEKLFSEESRKRIDLLHIRFETEKKQRESDINHLKNVELQKEIAERKRIEEELKNHQNHLEELVEERTAELVKLNTGLEKSFRGTIFTISRIVEERDPYSLWHQVRTAELASEIAEKMNLTEEQIQALYLAAVVHDIGKIKVPQEFLSRSGKLSEIELNLVRAYPLAGYNILKTIDFPWPIADIVLQHHEFLDGSGYPFGLKQDEIMLEAQILCVADMVEAMSSRRPYRPAFGLDETLEELSRSAGILYNSDITKACMAVVNEGKFKIREDSSRIST